MLREIDLNEISDGRKYRFCDMVRTDCCGCVGCSACCHDMGNSIVLDPMDVWQMTKAVGKSPEELAAAVLEFHMVDGLILPNVKMSGEGNACVFLNTEGRCSIHKFRPGICRMFPLGRYYEERSFYYFLQVHECPKRKSKIKVEKWLGISDIRKYEAYISEWHYFLKDVETGLLEYGEEERRQMSLYLLRQFYLKPYPADEFYETFWKRLDQAKNMFLN